MPLQWRTANVPQTLQNLRIIWAGISSKIIESSCYPSTAKLTPSPCPLDMTGIKSVHLKNAFFFFFVRNQTSEEGEGRTCNGGVCLPGFAEALATALPAQMTSRSRAERSEHPCSHLLQS